jgi:exodeoxyribonuclease-3
MSRVAAADVEQPALRREQRNGQIQQEVGRTRREALVEQLVQFRVIVSVDELHPGRLRRVVHPAILAAARPGVKTVASVVALMRVVSLNVNGIRAAVRRGLLAWITERAPDLICLQEIRATEAQLPLRELEQLGYESLWNLGDRPGYSGVGVLSRVGLEAMLDPLDDPATEHEGRFLAVRAGETVVTTSYVPNGNTGPERLAVKLTHLSALRDWAERRLAADSRLLLTGDFNVAAERIDVAKPTHPTGFLPSEREAFAALLDVGLADCFRVFHPGEPGHYTWWENWPGARERNLGWRFDYLLASAPLTEELAACRHEREPQLSDHCVVAAEFTRDGRR